MVTDKLKALIYRIEADNDSCKDEVEELINKAYEITKKDIQDNLSSYEDGDIEVNHTVDLEDRHDYSEEDLDRGYYLVLTDNLFIYKHKLNINFDQRDIERHYEGYPEFNPDFRP